MSRLDVPTTSKIQETVDELYRSAERRIAGSPPGLCPVDLTLCFLELYHAQSCGKCVPCRVGLGQLRNMISELLDGSPDPRTLRRIEKTATAIADTADCAIGITAAQIVLTGLRGFREDFEEHLKNHRCIAGLENPVPCVALCPAGVDIPGYISLIEEGRYADAVRLIRKDNPLPVSCAYICEHPCEARCRRTMVDDPLNIRGLKRYAVDTAGDVPQPECEKATGKKVAVIGGGPGGLSAAYYLALMGHSVTIFERRKQLGGMMRYGIPEYRLPRKQLDNEIDSILSLGIEVQKEVNIGTDISFEELKKKYDAIYISIGAQKDKKTGIDGEDSKGVISAVQMLRDIGDGNKPDFSGCKVAVIGGGNVAMDVTRSAIRLGAKDVTCVYRRRIDDMTAQREEIDGAIAEGAEVLTLHAPVRIEADESGKAVALWVQPQIIGEIDERSGRPVPVKADAPERRIDADIIIFAIGQGIDTEGFVNEDISIKRGGTLQAENSTRLSNMDGVFAGGDCVTGPATVIKAIAAGKTAAANIDEYLGFYHEQVAGVEIPAPRFYDLRPRGRINTKEREAFERKEDFACIECGFTDEEAAKEASRCLRCDHFGYGNFKGGRRETW